MVSVIVPTYNGAHKIVNVLRALEQQTCQGFEVLVVIDGSTDNTLEVLKETSFDLENLKIIYQENKGRAAVRNKAAQEAAGDLLIFFDDDMRPAQECVKAHIEHHKSFPDSIAVGTAINDYDAAHTEMQKYKCYCSRKWEQELKNFENQPLPKSHPYIAAANFSISKKMFETLGGFDERLNDAEDYDLAVRTVLKNIPIFYNQKAHAWHDEDFTMGNYIRRRKGYIQAHELLKRIKPEVYKDFSRHNPKLNNGVKKIMFWLFSSKVWPAAVQHFNFFRFLPQALRFKIYDVIITSQTVYFPQ